MVGKRKYSKVIHWGIIGCGDVTEVKSGPAYNKVEGFQLKAVMRRNPDKLKDYAKKHHIEKQYTKADDLINDQGIDAVYIATPPNTHAHYALKVAMAGKICCVEKPLASNYKDSKAIYEAFKTKALPLFVAYYRRSMPRFEQIRTWLRNNEIGEVRHLSWHLCKQPGDIDISGNYNWRTDVSVAPGGYFDDLASHGLDLFTYYLGDIEKVYGISCNQQKLYQAPDAFTACWLHGNGITGNGVWNFGYGHPEDRVEILGSKGKIQFAIFEEAPLLLIANGKTRSVAIANSENVQLEHVANMAKHLLEKDYQHPSTGYNGTHTSWVMDKILGVI